MSNLKVSAPVSISVLALLVSILSFLGTKENRRLVNENWQILNAPSIELDSVFFVAWKHMTHEEALSTNWGDGYEPDLVLWPPKHRDDSNVTLLSRLVAVDVSDSTNLEILKTNASYTFDELGQELISLGANTNSIEPARMYRIQVNLINNGRIKAKIRDIQIDAQFESEPEATRMNKLSKSDITIGPGRVFNQPHAVIGRVNKKLEDLVLRVKVTYDSAIKKDSTVLELKYFSNDGNWMYF